MVEVIDDGQELGFHVKSNVNLMRLLAVAISAAFVVYGAKHHVWIFAGMSFLGLCSFVRGVIKTTDEWVRANKDGIVADGSLIRWERIRNLSFDAGGEGAPSRFVIQTTSGAIRLFEDIGEASCEKIIASIYQRFPYAPMADDPGPPTIFGKWSEPTTLGLNQKD
jgi:hypothetical protein